MRWVRYLRWVSLERRYDDTLIAALASAEKQVQQAYRPVIQVHKWFARRPGSLFRGLLLAHFDDRPLAESYWESHDLDGVVLDPLQGGGTTLYEANRLGLSVVGYDTNPLSRWIVERKLEPLDVAAYVEAGEKIAEAVEGEIGHLYRTTCGECGDTAEVKFFIWTKTHVCAECDTETLVMSGALVAGRGMKRHTHDVLVCGHCRALHQFLPGEMPDDCPTCGTAYAETKVPARGHCRGCGVEFLATPKAATSSPRHTLIGIEYHCAACKQREGRHGRFFKGPDDEDHARFEEAQRRYRELGSSPYWPDNEIEAGDETNRLLRWGYRRWRELHNERQLLGLHLIAKRIAAAPQGLQASLATTFSDFIRYQNMVCRYDPAALKVLDVFSIHGFPVHRIQCEAALIGIPRVGSGAWRHWLAKYAAAKGYCHTPFETRRSGGRKTIVPTPGERIEGRFVSDPADLVVKRSALLRVASISSETLPAESVDLVATDPPYHDSVHYSELLDFCYAWLRRLVPDVPYFSSATTRSGEEASGNKTAGRGLEHYAEQLSAVYQAAARALKPGQPFVFTFHDNDLDAYGAVAVALLDAGLVPMRTIGCPSEMRGSIHINGSGSSRVDTVFVLRKPPAALPDARPLDELVAEQIAHIKAARLHVSDGDRRCLNFGVVTERVVRELRDGWQPELSIEERLGSVCSRLRELDEAPGTPAAGLSEPRGRGRGVAIATTSRRRSSAR